MEVGLQLVLTGKNKQQRTLYIAFADDKDRNAVHDAVANYMPDECKTEETPIIEYTK